MIPRAAKTSGRPPIASVGEGEQAMTDLGRIMDSLLDTVERETALVRDGRLANASQLETAKSELAGHYLAATERLKASRDFIQTNLPDALAALRQRHDTFHALLQINLTVLATAHAVSEGIVRGVSDTINRTQVPQTYGATGRATAPAPKNRQPIAVSRSL
jgi:hypothetical protein